MVSSYDQFFAAADMIIEDTNWKENNTFGPLCWFQPIVYFSLSIEIRILNFLSFYYLFIFYSAFF